MNLTLKIWRQKDTSAAGQFVVTHRRRGDNRHVFPGNVDVLNEELTSRRRSNRLRPRLPRGHLRVMRFLDQWNGARTASRHDRVPAPHAFLQGRR